MRQCSIIVLDKHLSDAIYTVYLKNIIIIIGNVDSFEFFILCRLLLLHQLRMDLCLPASREIYELEGHCDCLMRTNKVLVCCLELEVMGYR